MPDIYSVQLATAALVSIDVIGATPDAAQLIARSKWNAALDLIHRSGFTFVQDAFVVRSCERLP